MDPATLKMALQLGQVLAKSRMARGLVAGLLVLAACFGVAVVAAPVLAASATSSIQRYQLQLGDVGQQCDAVTTPVLALTAGPGEAGKAGVWAALRSGGFDAVHAAAAMGSMQAESGFDPQVVPGGGRSRRPADAGANGYGLVQWSPGSKLSDYIGGAVPTVSNEVATLKAQLDGKGPHPEEAAGAAFWAATDVASAARVFHLRYERAASRDSSQRVRLALAIYRELNGSAPPAAAAVSAAAPPATAPAAAGPALVAQLNPSGSGNWQSAVRDGHFWYVYQAPDAGHKGIIHRLNARGHELDRMVAEGADHAVSFTVVRGRVSVAFYGEVRTFTYRGGRTIQRRQASPAPWPHGEVSIDPAGRTVVIRNGNHYRAFDAATHKPTGVEVRTPAGPRQGVGVQGTTLYVLTGATNAPARVDSWDLTTGRQLGTVDVTGVGLAGGKGRREPEGMFGAQFGVKVYSGARRRLRVYQIGAAVAVPCSAAEADVHDAGAVGGGPVPARFDEQRNPRTVEEAVAYLQARTPRGISGYSVQGHCEGYMTRAYGHPGGYATALAHWNAPGPRHVGSDDVPPRGALVFYRTANPAGHVALSLGSGTVISTDYDAETHSYRTGYVTAGPIVDIDQWGPRLGWRAPNFRVGSEAA